MSSNYRNLILESISFGVLFFAKEIAAFIQGSNLQIDLQESGTLLLAIFSAAAFSFGLERKRQSAENGTIRTTLEFFFCTVLALSFIPLVTYAIRYVLSKCHVSSILFAWVLAALYLFIAAVLIFGFRNRFYLFTRKALLFSFPLALVLIGSLAKVAWNQEKTNQRFAGEASFLKDSFTLFLIFDEWDPSVIFAEENRGLFPACNRLRRESFYANRTYPSGPDTFPSMTSMTLGRFVNEISFEKGQLHVHFKDSEESTVWAQDPNLLFTQMSDRGYIVGAVGGMIVDYGKTFFPYIRKRSTAQTHTVWESFSDHFIRAFLLWIPDVRRGFCPMTVRFSRFTFENDAARLFDLIDRQECDFIFAHFIGGHFPTLNGFSKHSFSYLKNLKVVDDLLGKLEAHLRAKGMWDNVNCIITSDHWWRIPMSLEEGLSLNPLEIGRYAGKIDHTVPLFIKLKGQSNGFEYPEETSTLFLKELTLSLLDGRISSAFDLQTFFDEKGKSRSSEIAKWEGFKH